MAGLNVDVGQAAKLIRLHSSDELILVYISSH
jgi:hypothetical protein